jgi:hypothetical protein
LLRDLPFAAMTDGLPDPATFGAAFEDFMRAMTEVADRPESELAVRLREHLGTDPAALPTTAAEFATTDHPNLQLAFDAVLPDAEVIGYTLRHAGYVPVTLADVIGGHGMTGPIRQGPVQEVAIEVGDGRVVQCVATGMYVAVHDGAPVVLVRSSGSSARRWASRARPSGCGPTAAISSAGSCSTGRPARARRCR